MLIIVKLMSCQFILHILITNCSSYRLKNVSADSKLETGRSKTDVQRETAKPGDIFPDWVPFKNKHGDELGEFVQVSKVKPKKRLAPPMSFVLRSIAEQNQKDDKEISNTASEVDVIEIKDPETHAAHNSTSDNIEYSEEIVINDPISSNSTDSNDSLPTYKKLETALNHEEISEINGLVGILQKLDPNHQQLSDLLQKSAELDNNQSDSDLGESDGHLNETVTETVTESSGEHNVDPNEKEHNSSSEKDQEDNSSNEKVEENKVKEKTEEEKENEAKKAKILDEVDKLKARHEEEQKHIFRRNDDTEESLEDDEKNNYSGKSFRRYRDSESSESSDDDYEEEETIPTTSTTTTLKPRKLRRRNRKLPTPVKISYKPNSYLPEDLNKNNQIQDSILATTLQKQKYSARYVAPKETENIRISLVPTEETLLNNTSLEEAPVTDKIYDTSAAGSITAPDLTAPSSPDTTATGIESDSSAEIAAPSSSDVIQDDVQSSKIVAVTDTVPSGSEHKKQEEGDKEHSKGVGKEYHSEHSEEHSEKGKKAYEGIHKDTKSAKGHHDKETHHGNYDDHGGHDKHHHHESGHYGNHHHEEEGKKHAKYEESGKHSKGHSTKGSHDVHKKEEYEKKVEFFEEDGDSAEEEKHGGYNQEKEHSAGGHFKKGNLKADHHAQHKGETGHFVKGGHSAGHKGHKVAGGHDSHGHRGHSHLEKAGKDSGKKWVYHQGYPPSTANLVIIDRRGDRYQHGPLYYG